MFTKTSFHFFMIVLGVCLVTLGLTLHGQEVKAISGIMLGIGAGLFGMGISNLFTKFYEEKHPDAKRQKEIEFNDERNEMIRNKAKAKSGDITQWFIIGIAYLMILIDAPLWATGATVAVFALYNVLSLYLIGKYQQEM